MFCILNTINGFKSVPSAFAIKHTDTWYFSLPDDFIVTVRAPVLSVVAPQTISAQTGFSSIAMMFDEE